LLGRVPLGVALREGGKEDDYGGGSKQASNRTKQQEGRLMTFDYVWCGRKEDSYAPPLPELHPFLFSSASKVKRSLGWMAVEEEEENMI
jgi:hypothetical protein